MKQVSYGDKQRAYAQALIEAGAPYDEIVKDSALEGFNRSTLRSMRLRHNEKLKAEKDAKKVGAATAGTETKRETATETPGEPAAKPGFLREMWRLFHPADLLYYGCVVLAGFGVVQALHVVGGAVAAIYFAVAVIALHGIKTGTGWNRLPHFILIAVVEAVGFAAHTVWANKALWSDVKALPFDIWIHQFKNDLGKIEYMYQGADLDKPGMIALGVAGFMLCCTIYVCWIAIQKSQTKQ